MDEKVLSSTPGAAEAPDLLLEADEAGGLDCGEHYVSEFRFWCDGVLVSVVGSVGFVGNLIALIILSRPKLRDTFHQLLFALACFDLAYIVCGGVNYTFHAFRAQSDIFTYLFPYFIFPLTHISMAGTIFMTVAITIERYLGLCHPFLPLHSRKAWFYVLPVTFVSVVLNIPKFLEIQLVMEVPLEDHRPEAAAGNASSYSEEASSVPPEELLAAPEYSTTAALRPAYRPSQLRMDEDYIRGYIMWTRLFSTAIIPVVLLLVLNARIIMDLAKSGNVQRFGGSAGRQRKEINLSIVLLCIVVVFFCCHATRIVLDIHEFSNLEKVISCNLAHRSWNPSYLMQALMFVSHTAMIINSSINFVVYCLVGHTFRRELCRALGLRRYLAVPGGTTGGNGVGGVGGDLGLSLRSSKLDRTATNNSTTQPALLAETVGSQAQGGASTPIIFYNRDRQTSSCYSNGSFSIGNNRLPLQAVRDNPRSAKKRTALFSFNKDKSGRLSQMGESVL